MKFFRQKKEETLTKTEQDFQKIVDIVKNLDRNEFKKFMEATQSVWEGYDRLLRVKTRDEKEAKPVDDITNSFIETAEDK